LALEAAADHTRAREARQAGERRVLDCRAAEEEALVLARLRNEPKPARQRARRAPPECRAVGERDGPGLQLRGAEERARELRAARADEAGDADDLACPNDEAGVVD